MQRRPSPPISQSVRLFGGERGAARRFFLTGEGVAVLLGLLQRGLQAADFALFGSELAGHLVQSPLQRLLAF